ncbi:MBOAT family O-acyltransferase [Heyndrickxia sp. MSNUG]|uniref:MBOAT family O-acyltransferase n=1 Tax=Heyndrickxia sp. MSNUG TaxID=3136677 RepID=UPI003C2F6552
MLFNSYEFIFFFLPASFIIYFALQYAGQSRLAKISLVLGSLIFYSWWNISYLPLILTSVVVNYGVGTFLGNSDHLKKRRIVLTIGIVFNVILLGYYKYTDFFLSTVNAVAKADFPLLHLALPLAISFFTFQQIAYLVDSFRYETKGYRFDEYMLFVIFFPQLIAGPIVHHKEVMSQFHNENSRMNAKNISLGLYIFGIGLFKKVMIADTFSVWANDGFKNAFDLNVVEAWIASLSYTFQLYFDFSGYCDMAVGAALLFNIRLPINFNSPYKALNIQDFWRRWHITLSRFLTQYIYIPLGGSRISPSRTYINIMIIFMVSGFWHGAGWTFVLWGFLHGLASVIYRWWSQRGYKMPKWLAWFITFQFVNAAWVLFRAETFAQAIAILKAMFGMGKIELPTRVARVLEPIFNVSLLPDGPMLFTSTSVLLIVLGLIVVTFRKNSFEMLDRFKPNNLNMLFIVLISIVSILQLGKVSEFLYFNF